MNRPVIAVTAGEPAGIGPDICLALAGRASRARLVVLGDRTVLAERARSLGLATRFRDYDARGDDRDRSDAALEVLHVPVAGSVQAGVLDPRNARHVIAILDRAIDGCLTKEFAAIATAPLQKSVINDAGIPFTGHTEYLADRTNAPQVVMMLAGAGLRVALVTTHLPLASVSAAITPTRLEAVIRVLAHDLRMRFAIARPRIVVAGLNPHAGESGHLGREDIDVILPTLERLRAEGMDLIGPLPADTLFNPSRLVGVDCVLAMYHDQGLPVLKFASFGAGVNITLGLPFVRTSVDHGTALDLAGSGRAEPGSLFEAIDVAIAMVQSVRAMPSTA